MDTKKKELVGDFKNGGCEYQRVGEPEQVRVHDFKDPLLGKAIPYGVYDIARNEGWVNVGIDRDTSAFAVESIRRWWFGMGKERSPNATQLMISGRMVAAATVLECDFGSLSWLDSQKE